MIERLSDLGLLENIFLVCALAGGVVFAIRMALQLTGVFDDFDGDVDVDHDISDHADSDADFKLLTIQGITAFFMMFGLVGLMLKVGAGAGGLLSSSGAMAAGVAALYFIAKTMAWMKTLQSSGTINEKNAIGQEGSVYLTIPAGGIGKVHVDLQGKLMEFDAESADGSEIRTGEQVRVVYIKGSNLLVEKI